MNRRDVIELQGIATYLCGKFLEYVQTIRDVLFKELVEFPNNHEVQRIKLMNFREIQIRDAQRKLDFLKGYLQIENLGDESREEREVKLHFYDCEGALRSLTEEIESRLRRFEGDG